MFEELSPPYNTIVVDPPWHYTTALAARPYAPHLSESTLPYQTMSLDEIKGLPIGDLGADARCYLWTTNKYLENVWDVMRSWGFEPQSRIFVWCKPPMGTLPVTTEFFLVGKKGRPPQQFPWVGTTWFQWPRPHHAHSKKPDAFFDLIEQWSPAPRVEIFARQNRVGWDGWGDQLDGDTVARQGLLDLDN